LKGRIGLLATRGAREDKEGIIPPAIPADHLRTCNKQPALGKDAIKPLRSCHERKEFEGHGQRLALPRPNFFPRLMKPHRFFSYLVSGSAEY